MTVDRATTHSRDRTRGPFTRSGAIVRVSGYSNCCGMTTIAIQGLNYGLTTFVRLLGVPWVSDSRLRFFSAIPSAPASGLVDA